MTDPIADMLSRIRNAILAKHKEVVVPQGLQQVWVSQYSQLQKGL